ncbi:MAG: UPF0179 family protein [Candidatus Lokiarchaeota archaeon]|nr:UPF0179 family protein [Candidatus Harpocratesius repetitus]
MTFVGKSFAKKGFIFFFEGVHASCPKNCVYYSTCQANLKPHTLYEIVDVKKKQFTCPQNLHTEEMVLVQLEEPKLKITMYNKDIYEGSITSFTPIGCDNEDCAYINYCAPQSIVIKSGEKIKILKIVKKIKECPRNLTLSLCEIEKRVQN